MKSIKTKYPGSKRGELAYPCSLANGRLTSQAALAKALLWGAPQLTRQT